MEDPILHFLRRFGVVILDGALATELERRGADLNDALWSAKMLIEAPELIRQVHFDYFQAGADVATTASYQATFEGFSCLGLSPSKIERLLQRSVELADEARREFWRKPTNREGRLKPLIAASVGSYGAFLADGSEYRGDYSISEYRLRNFHRRRMDALLKASPDLLALETIPCLKEGKTLVELLEEFPDARAWMSFSCKDAEHVCHGEPFQDCVEMVARSEQVIAVGVNCTSPAFVEPLLSRAARVTEKPLVAYPNSGEDWDANTRSWKGSGLDRAWAKMAIRWHRAGARLIGGCCRTTPSEIRSAAAALRPSVHPTGLR